MQALTSIHDRRRRRPGGKALITAAALAALSVTAGHAAAACPWIVQPYAGESISTQRAGGESVYDITFHGLDHTVGAFYAFSLSSVDVAWQLARQSSLPALEKAGRRLEPVETALGTAYRLSEDTIEPHIIYLATARVPVEALEQIDARIEPVRPTLTAFDFRTRGPSDQSGPLGHMSVPGHLVADASAGEGPNLQICAYQVAMR